MNRSSVEQKTEQVATVALAAYLLPHVGGEGTAAAERALDRAQEFVDSAKKRFPSLFKES